MTKANRDLLDRKKAIGRKLVAYTSFNEVPSDVKHHIRINFQVNEEFMRKIYFDVKSGILQL